MAKTENRKQTEIIKAFAPAIIKVLKEITEKKELSQTARALNIQVSRLSEIASGTREISAYYLGKLLKGGIVTLDHILQGRNLDELTEDEQDILFSLRMSKNLIKLLREAEKASINAEAILEAVLPNKQQ